MGYKTIAVHLNESTHNYDRMQIAARLAQTFEAHLIGTASTGLPEWFYMPGMVGEPGIVLRDYLQVIEEQSKTLIATFDALADRIGLRSYEHRVIAQETGAALCLQARYSDLLIVGQTDPKESLASQREDVPQYLVLHSPRPVLMIPYAGNFETFGKRIVIGWNAGMPAARAVTAALPFLKRAEAVQVAVFNPQDEQGAHGEQPGADIALFLARHGVKVEVAVSATGGEVDNGNALLSHLTDWGADMFVMGCYGHSRFREVLLGGVTRTMLNAMTVPVLMAH